MPRAFSRSAIARVVAPGIPAAKSRIAGHEVRRARAVSDEANARGIMTEWFELIEEAAQKEARGCASYTHAQLTLATFRASWCETCRWLMGVTEERATQISLFPPSRDCA
jgi:hypothetical protein